MADPILVPVDALVGRAIAISVSDSADLGRLGLTAYHCDLAVAEIARAIFLAGGQVIYGGRLKPAGFTDVLIDEAIRYGRGAPSVILCVAASEHLKMKAGELAAIEEKFGIRGELHLLNQDGSRYAGAYENRESDVKTVDAARALSSMREYSSSIADARVLVGGQLSSHEGNISGVIEEAILSLADDAIVYAAAGYGGAAAVVSAALAGHEFDWMGPEMPIGASEDSSKRGISMLKDELGKRSLRRDGLSPEEREQLAASHRPGEIASLVVRGLSRAD